jgi:hypothetical protein
MIGRRLATVIFGARRRRVTRVPITPEFGVKVLLRVGDKIVRRNAKGEIEVMTVTRGGERLA